MLFSKPLNILSVIWSLEFLVFISADFERNHLLKDNLILFYVKLQ